MKIIKQILIVLVILGTITLIGGTLVMKLTPAFGGHIKGDRLERIKKSVNYKDGKFQNTIPTVVQSEDFSIWEVLKEMSNKDGDRAPQEIINVQQIDKSTFNNQKSGIKSVWLGHSTLLIQIDGFTILTDPVFSERTSPFSWGGTKRFDYSINYHVEHLPKIDLVIISHDHYDHLDYKTIQKLKNKNIQFVMPLGVGAHFERWGFKSDEFRELDWMESFNFKNKIEITATPARHFSGRGITDRNKTLWASWVIKSDNQSVFFSGDSGYFPGFKEIGNQYGSFDLCIIECGQYGKGWPYIHMTPEQTVQAHVDLKGKILLPIHWAKFKLSLHKWYEPIERALKEAEKTGSIITTPQIGETISIEEYTPQNNWWQPLISENLK